jgi:cytochrome b involved in lipid metabolism
MDRLHVVSMALVGLVAAGGCEREGGNKKQPPAAGDRVDAVKAGQEKKVSAEEFCDVRAEASKAPALVMPALAGGQSAPGNEEMPHLAKWQKELAGEGVRFDLVFVSVDDSDDLVTRFRERHPGTPESLRLADPDALPKWMGSIGIDEAAPIPVHVFVDPDDRVRCVRAGGVKEKDLPAVRSILGAT